MNKNPLASTSDILEFISEQDDFYEDAAYAEMDTVQLNQRYYYYFHRRKRI